MNNKKPARRSPAPAPKSQKNKENQGNFADHGYLRVAAATPEVFVGDPARNAAASVALAKKAVTEGASVVVFPELGLTGYTAGDLFQQRTLERAVDRAVESFCRETATLDAAFIIGLPVRVGGLLANVGAVVAKGKIWGAVPKLHLPNYKEFYEKRWFASGRELRDREVTIAGQRVPIGADLLFRLSGRHDAVIGIEICEDLWVPIPPSTYAALAGATILANLSASNELVGKAGYRRSLVESHSARAVSAYLYSCAGAGESTTDTVFAGHSIVAENGETLAETPRLTGKAEIAVADIDLERIAIDRSATTSFADSAKDAASHEFRTVEVPVSGANLRELRRAVAKSAFVPEDAAARVRVAEEVLSIQVAGLRKRLASSRAKALVLGLSGGLDSALAFLVAARALDELGRPRTDLHAISMPGPATGERTRKSAADLAAAIGATFSEIPIGDGVDTYLAGLGHDGETQDITFENAQARYRTYILMGRANQNGGLVVGTGDLSEAALGWCTFTGDHISHYNPNAGVPKTLVRHVVDAAAGQIGGAVETSLRRILDTPISPELTTAKKGKISQETEQIIGPYELHDFFLYHFLRWRSSPAKIRALAKIAFAGKYGDDEIRKWLRVFCERFFRNQWKRSVAVDGPKVGSVALSPRGDWRMPSDAELSAWEAEL